MAQPPLLENGGDFLSLICDVLNRYSLSGQPLLRRIPSPCSSSRGAAYIDSLRLPSKLNAGRTALSAPSRRSATGTTSPKCLTCGSCDASSTVLTGANGTS